VSDLGAAACGEAELTKRSAASQLATAATRSLQPPSCPLSEHRRAGRPKTPYPEWPASAVLFFTRSGALLFGAGQRAGSRDNGRRPRGGLLLAAASSVRSFSHHERADCACASRIF
jgi:hypothetical protein